MDNSLKRKFDDVTADDDKSPTDSTTKKQKEIKEPEEDLFGTIVRNYLYEMHMVRSGLGYLDDEGDFQEYKTKFSA